MVSAVGRWATFSSRGVTGARALRARIGARWGVVALLVPLAVFGAVRFGPRAALVVVSSVFCCASLGIVTRVMAGQPWRYLNAGSLVTGLLLGLTLSADTPLSLILLGAAVAEVAGKHRARKLGTNPFNPAALGRAAVAVVELASPAATPSDPDVISRASPLYVGAGGSPAPEFFEMLAGTTPGAIGETSAALLLLTGAALVAFVAVKREATVGMLGAVVFLVLVLPASSEIHGHAPWVLNPIVYLLGGPIFLYAFFFVTDPATTPNSRLGGLAFGAGVGTLGVLGRLYTTIPGPEMWAILLMNPLAPTLDRWLGEARTTAPAPGEAVEEGVRSFYDARSVEGSEPPGLIAEGLEDMAPVGASAFDVLGRVTTRPRVEVIERVRESGLRGCGGARFPAATKWEAVRRHEKPRVLVVNGQEGEPDSFKDRVLMERHPALVIAGAAMAAHVIEASEIHIVHPPGNASIRDSLEGAIAALAAVHPELAGRFTLTPGSGLYVCGEESALLAFLEGKRGEPRERPPHPTECGLWGRPTVVHNVETLAWLPRLISAPHATVSELGRLVSVSGAVEAPGVYLVSRDVPLSKLVERAGGEASAFGYAVGGPTGELLPGAAAGTTVGALPGTGTLRVLSSSSCPVAEALTAARFAAKETCGRCTPCRVGSSELERMWGEVVGGTADERLVDTLVALSDTMAETSACGFGRDAPRRTLSVLRSFPEIVADHLESRQQGEKAKKTKKTKKTKKKGKGCEACRRSG